MNKADLRIIFIGTPQFAVATLDALKKNNFNVVAVITSVDKAAGRGLQLQQSDVKQYAVANNIRILQPSNLKSEEFINTLKSFKANLQIVVAFRMLPEIVWNMPEHGTFNVHASLLPNYRGAAPINWAIINGEKETGVSTFKLKHAIDTGNVLLQEKVTIEVTDNAGSLHDKLMNCGAQLLIRTLAQFLDGSLREVDQENIKEETNWRHAPKIFTANCQIDWNKNAIPVYNFIRGLSPYPTAFTNITLRNGSIKKLKIFNCLITDLSSAESLCGTWQTDNKLFLYYACADKLIAITDLQLEGKKRMLVQEFLRGNNL
jgi:methionyl-tRNA formyltransferase